MRLATADELAKMEAEAGVQWKQADIVLTVYASGDGSYIPSLDKSPMFQCLKCEGRYLLDACDNCGNNTFKCGGDERMVPQVFATAKGGGSNQITNTKDMGVFCQKCGQGITVWQCQCGAKNPVTKTLFILKKGGCFIATAAYGSPYAPQIILLQQFRDMRLRKTWFGPSIISTYERYSPPLANWIARHPIARLSVQKLFLAPIISVLRYRK
jgi:hypothetical protein